MGSSYYVAIWLGVGLLLIFILLWNQYLSIHLEMKRKARLDYRTSRGTKHKEMIESSMRNLNSLMASLVNDIQQKKSKIVQLQYSMKSELKRELSTQIVNTQLEDVHGIGPTLKMKIIHQCFNGDLRSILSAQQVSGIGYGTQSLLSEWVNAIEREIPIMLKGDFPGKSEINNKYESQMDELEKECRMHERSLNKVRPLEEKGTTHLRELSAVTESSFVRSYSDQDPSNLIVRYISGLFPEWEEPPGWFKTLTENYGGNHAQ